ncbi:glycosyltransferase family 2 protein [Neobacillus drentensis]|uniref:glycosyltransferase family 2 protein n=1 Tax=Neobacillus drentensis TaxID=220684 RepID=UPI001F43E804|nr:glycosyltransferase family 2 protein [Neobacillus drentensis]ULT57322.1 glycosyltransferase family 2 protein [Neobacillus drentensis]
MEKVDILLPIYNSVSETRNCIESILENTPQDSFNLYLLDDKSTDVQIEYMTKYYSENYPKNIFAIRNNENLGFPGNVNNGFAITKNDVIILNSDTLVAGNWLKILADVACSDESIAAINPMSNYGVLAGLPTPNSTVNELFSFKELATAFQKSKETGYIETPLLIGFCMYMKRNALKTVGVFDAEAFKRGYGEETDWCMRARQKGYKLAVAKAAYVHHIGGSSFGAEKEQLQKRSREILLQRYPQIDTEIEQFVKGNHFKAMRRNMMCSLPFFQKKAGGKLKIKMIKHFVSNRI